MSASTLDQQATTVADEAPPAPAPTRQGRRRLVLSATLALAALGVGGAAGGVLVTGTAEPAPVIAASPAAPVPAASAPAPSAPAPAAPAAPGPTSPDSDLPAGGATVVDATGTPLPAPTVAGVRTLYDALARGDLAAVRTAYAPATSGAPWSAVEQVLADTRDRAGLLAAMRTPPQARGVVPYLYARDGYRLGLDDAGSLRFVRAP